MNQNLFQTVENDKKILKTVETGNWNWKLERERKELNEKVKRSKRALFFRSLKTYEKQSNQLHIVTKHLCCINNFLEYGSKIHVEKNRSKQLEKPTENKNAIFFTVVEIFAK